MTRPVVQQFAGHYRHLGYGVVRLHPRSKQPIVDDWRNREPGADDFKDGENIGLLHRSGLVISDPDCDEAVALAEAFLPPTGAVYGRGARPRMKRLYHCPELTKTVVFLDLQTGKPILEERVNGQDMIPPSDHEDGNRLKWHGLLLAPSTYTLDHLQRCHRLLASAALTARYWPGPGARHDWALALAGLFRSLKLEDLEVVRIFSEAAHYVGDPDDRRDDVTSTYARSDATFKQAGALQRLGHDTLVRSLRAIWDAEHAALDSRIQQLNERFAIVSLGATCRVMEIGNDGTIANFWPYDEFKKKLIKQRVIVAGRNKSLAEVWIQHSLGAQYDQLKFDMPGSVDHCGPDDYNGWRGFRVKPEPGDWSKTHAFIKNVVCANNEQHLAWTLNWIASLLQYPGRHASTAIVLRGGQGTGKGTFADVVLGGFFYLQQYIHLGSAAQLTGRFNEHLSGKTLVFADEATWGGDVQSAEKLKGLVTEPTVAIERKFLPLVEEPSAMHIVIASNSDWPVSIPRDDRRFCVLQLSDEQQQNTTYFGAVREELTNGGRAAMLHDMLQHEIDTDALRHPPSSNTKRELATFSLSPVERWWFAVLERGTLSAEPAFDEREPQEAWPDAYPKPDLHRDYLTFLSDHRDGRSRHSTQVEVGIFLKRVCPGVSDSKATVGGRRVMVWRFPNLDRCRAEWERQFRSFDGYDWPI